MADERPDDRPVMECASCFHFLPHPTLPERGECRHGPPAPVVHFHATEEEAIAHSGGYSMLVWPPVLGHDRCAGWKPNHALALMLQEAFAKGTLGPPN